jgi:hypothetical protein
LRSDALRAHRATAAAARDLGSYYPLMPSLTSTPQADDAGADAFPRYPDQAHVVFPLTLRVYFVGDIVAISCERGRRLRLLFADR